MAKQGVRIEKMRDNQKRNRWFGMSSAAFVALAVLSAPWWASGSCWLIDLNYVGDVTSFINHPGLAPQEARDFTKQVANEYLDGFGRGNGDPGERYLNASYCYSALADSAYGRSEDRVQAEVYVKQALAKSKKRVVLADSLAHLASIYVLQGRPRHAQALVSRARRLAVSKSEGADFANAVVQAIREAKDSRK